MLREHHQLRETHEQLQVSQRDYGQGHRMEQATYEVEPDRLHLLEDYLDKGLRRFQLEIEENDDLLDKYQKLMAALTVSTQTKLSFYEDKMDEANSTMEALGLQNEDLTRENEKLRQDLQEIREKFDMTLV